MKEEAPLSLYWMTTNEAVDYHFENTPIPKRLHRTAVYRWIQRDQVKSRRFGNQVYVSRISMESFCQDGYDSSPRRNNKP
jgi:hypothetical protein